MLRSVAFILVCLMPMVSPAYAKYGMEFNHFRVPIALSGLPAGTKFIVVSCYIEGAGGSIVAGGETTGEASGERVEREVVLRIRGNRGANWRGARQYACRFILGMDLPDGRPAQFWSSDMAAPRGWHDYYPPRVVIPRAAGTAALMSVRGSISPSEANLIALAGEGECPCGCGARRGAAGSRCTVPGVPSFAPSKPPSARPLPRDPSSPSVPAAPPEPTHVEILTSPFKFTGTGVLQSY